MSGLQLHPERPLIPIIKVVGTHCNIRCSYCFYNQVDQATPHRMSDEILERFTREYLSLFKASASFIWHGGEPLLAGVEFYRRAVVLQDQFRAPGQTINNLIQTNGTLMTDEWAAFFKTHNFGVGLSIDGTEEQHDAFRRDAGNMGSFARVISGIEVLRRHGVKFGVIQVLTADKVGRVRESFRFFADTLQAKNWSMNLFSDRSGYSCAGRFSLTNDDVIKAVEDCTDEWLKHGNPRIRIREIEALIAGVKGKRCRACTFNGSCMSHFCLDHDGGIFPCDSFSNSPGHRLGSIGTNSLADILTGEARATHHLLAAEQHEECRDCRWFPMCHNGCPAERIGGINGKYMYCEARKTLFSKFEHLANKSLNKN